VTGIMIIVLLGPQSWMGGWFTEYGVRIVFAWPAIVLALLFVTFPLTVRAVQPVLEEVDIDQEEAAHSLGASQWQTFRRVLLPALSPAIISGGLLTFARALGEFGSIVIVSGNIPARTLTAPVHIFGEIEAGNARGASAMSLVLIAIAVTVILSLDWFQHRRLGKRHEAEL
jgi:sulfate/thiosulfate transport system permease protein